MNGIVGTGVFENGVNAIGIINVVVVVFGGVVVAVVVVVVVVVVVTGGGGGAVDFVVVVVVVVVVVTSTLGFGKPFKLRGSKQVPFIIVIELNLNLALNITFWRNEYCL